MISLIAQRLRLISSKTSANCHVKRLFSSSTARNDAIVEQKPSATEPAEAVNKPAFYVSQTMSEYEQEGAGETIDNPIFAPAITSRTIVGCRCKEYSQNLWWFYLDEGTPQQCDCGVYFQLMRVPDDNTTPLIVKEMSVSHVVIEKCARTRNKRAYEKKIEAGKQ